MSKKKAKRTNTTQADLLENVAAISAEVWGGDSKFYDRHGHALSGFPGVWMFCVDAARIFTKGEQKFARVYGVKPKASYEYLDAILPFAEWLASLRNIAGCRAHEG